VAEFTVKLAAWVVPKFTAVTPVKLVPTIVTEVPPVDAPVVGPMAVIVGVAAVAEMVYWAVATALEFMPGAAAMALSVWLWETVMGLAHFTEEVVGALPSLVQ
jgi:hypothetical protein